MYYLKWWLHLAAFLLDPANRERTEAGSYCAPFSWFNDDVDEYMQDAESTILKTGGSAAVAEFKDL